VVASSQSDDLPAICLLRRHPMVAQEWLGAMALVFSMVAGIVIMPRFFFSFGKKYR
jgi:hypothetical protein